MNFVVSSFIGLTQALKEISPKVSEIFSAGRIRWNADFQGSKSRYARAEESLYSGWNGFTGRSKRSWSSQRPQRP